MNKTLSVIVPAYNEQHTVGPILDKIKAVVLPDGMSKEIVVVNDGSTDRTVAILNRRAGDPLIKVFHQANAGKTAALLHGLKQATGDIFVVQDADLEYDPQQLPLLLAPILKGEAQVVYGSRFLGSIQEMKPINRYANVISNCTLGLLWGQRLTDINTCYKMFTREAVAGIDIHSSHFGFDTEVTVKFLKKGLRIIEIPIRYKARTRQEGKKMRWSTALKMYWQLIRHRFPPNDANAQKPLA